MPEVRGSSVFSLLKKKTKEFMEEYEYIEFYELIYHHELFTSLKETQLIYSDIPSEKENNDEC